MPRSNACRKLFRRKLMEEVESIGIVTFDTSNVNTRSGLFIFGLLNALLTRLHSQTWCLATIVPPEQGVLPHLWILQKISTTEHYRGLRLQGKKKKDTGLQGNLGCHYLQQCRWELQRALQSTCRMYGWIVEDNTIYICGKINKPFASVQFIYLHIRVYRYIRGWSEKFSASTIDDNNIGKIFFPLSWHIYHKHPCKTASHSIK
jgi:hypothetical protein